MDATEVLYTTPANTMNALSTEVSLTPTMKLQQQTLPLSPLATTTPQPAAATTPTTPTTPRTTTHTPREIPTMYILDQMYDDYVDQYNVSNISIPTEVPETDASVKLAPCPICSRTFNPVTLRKHVGICEKMAMKKRNKFDSSRQRREGTELASYPLPKNFGLPEKTTSNTSIAQARNDRGQSPKPAAQQVSSPILTRKKPSEDLIRTTARASMRKAVAGNNGTISAVPAASSTPSSNFNRDRMRSSERSLTRRGIQPPPAEQCPHCERCFGIKAYDRHVEWCKEKALLASIKQGNAKNEGNVAKARLEARTKYRAPCLKTKRSINREKYSGLAGDEQDTEDNSKCSKTSLNKTQENSLMSMSMTSSMCSERQITNSTTGNINEAIAIKRQKNGSKNHISTRDISQTRQPPTNNKSMTAAPTPNINKEAIINLEFEIPEFLVMDEQITETVINKKLRNNTTKRREDTVTAAKIKQLKQKQFQFQQPTEQVKLPPINSKKSDQNRKTTTDVDLPSSASRTTTTILEQQKSRSDLCLKAMLRDQCLQQTLKAFEVDSDYHNDRKCHYDNVLSSLDGAQFEANKAPVENVTLSKSLTHYASFEGYHENEESEKNFPIINTPEQKDSSHVTMTMEQYFEREIVRDCNVNFATFHNHESDNNACQSYCNDSNVELEEAQDPDISELTENLNLPNDFLQYQDKELIAKKSYEKFFNNYCTENAATPQISITPNTPTKIYCNNDSKEIATNFSCTQDGETEEYFKSEDSHLGEEVYKDCLTDSDELRRRGITNKQDTYEEISARELTNTQLQNCFRVLQSSSKSDTFIVDQSELQEFQDNYEKFAHRKSSKNPENLSRNSSVTRSNERIKETAETNHTPRKCRTSTPPPPTLSNSAANISNIETSRLMSLKMSQLQRKKVLRQTVKCTNTSPMKAVMWPFCVENRKIDGVASAPQTKSAGKSGVEKNTRKNKEQKYNYSDVSNMKRNTCALDEGIKVIKEPTQMKRNRSLTVFGLPDNYDPFLSAKRQLEELCSPSAEFIDMPTTPLTPNLPSMPVTPKSNSKMSTSLILSSSTPNTTPNTNPMTTSQIPQQTQKTPTLARSSSFRRTASLRGPRRSPMLSSRPPLFAQKHRPTIQRGLSDEGPISTNFLKPEEYDEMPVRSVCVNDFAINKSPRVVRRDTSNSNRKQPLKLNVNAANANSSSNTVSPSVMDSEALNNNTASKYVSKTDSLAVFLKFEHELEKLNTASLDKDHNRESLANTPSIASTTTTPLSNLDGPLNAKELKDKSNNLSKQNSAKNIKADILAANDDTENYDKNLNNNSQPSTNDLETGKYAHVRLAPLNTKPSTPLTKPTTPQLPAQHDLATQLTPLNIKNSLAQNQELKLHKSPKPVALSSLFGGDNKSMKQTSLHYSEHNNSTSSNYIDPKLINKCDNLPINLNLKCTDFKHSDSDASEPRLEHFSSSSSESSAAAPDLAKKTTSQTQHTKFLPTVKQQQTPQQEQQHEQNINFKQNHLPQQLPLSVTNSQRNSTEGRNLLKRRMRLGRNQFLYDASPEGDSCSADDEGANRSSMEGDASQQHYNTNSSREREKAFDRLNSPQFNPIDTPFIAPLPPFDDFDFEEFLSSFENDGEQFPLFKDCREFLMNRTSKKQRSMLMSNSAIPNSDTNTHNSTNLKKSPSPQTFPPLTPQSHPNTGQHFQFPSLPQHPKNLFNSFSLNDRQRNKYDELTAAKSTDRFCVHSHKEEYKDFDSQSLNQKREIFISIETEQNDLDKTSISPNSIRNMVGNPQTVVEVEVDAADDNKFSKISDDDAEVTQNNARSKNFSGHLMVEHLPNVQLNNAKNLMQKVHEDFRQMGDEMAGNLRLTKEHRTTPVDMNMNTNATMNAKPHNMLKLSRTTGAPSGDAFGDSDELSSLDGYPLSSPNSRLGVSSKTSADSAYGSLSRHRSSELTSQRSSSRNRTMTSNTATTLLSRPLTEETSLGRLRQLSASSSSSSEHALPPINSSNNYLKQQQQQQHMYSNNNNIDDVLDDVRHYEPNNNNSSNNSYDVETTHSNSNLTGAANSHSNLESLQHFNSNSTMSTSMKMSKFCHECGSKFLLEQAKFCMDCGVKRIVL